MIVVFYAQHTMFRNELHVDVEASDTHIQIVVRLGICMAKTNGLWFHQVSVNDA